MRSEYECLDDLELESLIRITKTCGGFLSNQKSAQAGNYSELI